MRRKSREVLLQLLFEAEHGDMTDPQRLIDNHFGEFPQKSEVSDRVAMLFLSINKKKKELDAFIEKYADHWKLHRMSPVDRNILRTATYELFYCDDVPAEVVFDEAIEVAKRFGSEDSGAFVNGVLDKIWHSKEKQQSS